MCVLVSQKFPQGDDPAPGALKCHCRKNIIPPSQLVLNLKLPLSPGKLEVADFKFEPTSPFLDNCEAALLGPRKADQIGQTRADCYCDIAAIREGK